MTRTVSLEDVAEINPRMPDDIRHKAVDELVPFLAMSSVSEDGTAQYGMTRPLGQLLKGYTYFGRGDVLLAKITPCFENGKAAHLVGLPSEVGFGSTEFHVLRPGPEIDGRYLFHALWNERTRAKGAMRMTGSAGQKRVPAEFLRELEVPLPTLHEQRRIAAILDKANLILVKQSRLRQIADSFLSSVFHQLFGDLLQAQPGAVEHLEDVSDIASGVTKGPGLKLETRNVPYLRVANVQDGYLKLGEMKTIDATLGEIERFRLRAGDLILTEGGDPDKLGRGAVWHAELPECIHQNHIFRVRLTDEALLPDYVSALLGSPYGKRYFLKAAKQTTGIASINRRQLGAFPVVRASIHSQSRYAAVVERVQSLTERLEKARASSELLGPSLQASLLAASCV